MFSECGEQGYSDLVSDFCFIILKVQLQKQNFLFSKLSENKTFMKWLSSFKYRAMLALFASREIFLFFFLNTGSHFVGLTGLGPGWPLT